jgi:hypothetical protein
MQFVIEQDNDNQFHWRLVGDDGAYVVVSAASFASAKGAPRRNGRGPARWVGHGMGC